MLRISTMATAWAVYALGIAPQVLQAGACNDAPVAVADHAAALYRPVVIDVLANDSDAEGHLLTLSVASGGSCAGPRAVVGDLLRYTPAASLASTCTLRYRVTDDLDDFAEATVTVTPAGIFGDGFESSDTSAWADLTLSPTPLRGGDRQIVEDGQGVGDGDGDEIVAGGAR